MWESDDYGDSPLGSQDEWDFTLSGKNPSKNVRKNWDLDGFGDLFFESPAILGVQGFDRFDQQMDRFDQQMGNAYYFDQFQGF
jgi:hypothetical protein